MGHKPNQSLIRPAKTSRVLAICLLVSLGWAITAEFTHHHGAQFPTSRSQVSISADQINLAQVQPSGTNRSSSTKTSGLECLICQLHQNLSTTELNQPPGVGAAETQNSHPPTTVAVHLSDFAATQHGRAPPVNL
jgi:hypothetical protein